MTTFVDPFNDTDGPVETGEDWNDPDLPAVDSPAFQEASASEGPRDINPATGKPYKMSAEERRAFGERMAAARRNKAGTDGRTRATAARKSAPRAPQARPVKPTGPNYRPAVNGLLSIPIATLSLAARFAPTLMADALAIEEQAGPIADAVHDLAVDDPRIAALLERTAAVGPYGALFGAMLPVVMQIAANHGFMAPNPRLGIRSWQQVIAEHIPEAMPDAARTA